MHLTYSQLFCYLGVLLCLLSCKPAAQTLQGEAPRPEPVLAETAPEKRVNLRLQRIREKEQALQGYKASATRTFDLVHTDLWLAFDYAKKAVMGEALLTVTPYFYEQNTLVVDAVDFEVHEAVLQEGVEQIPLAFTYDQQALTLVLPKTFSKGDTLQVGIRYTAFPEKGSSESSAAFTDTKGLYFINADSTDSDKPVQIWTQGETEFTSKWYPTIDHPNERQTHDFHLRVPEGYRSLSNGKLLGSLSHGDGTRTDHWRMDMPHAPYLSAVVVGDFAAVDGGTVDGIPLRYFVEPKFQAGAKKVFAHTGEMMRFFSDLLDLPFPWQKYDQVVVRDFVSGAMENTTLSVFMEALQLNEREALDSEWDYIIAHELFHQWFGNYVTTESWANLTLNEAFADYSEYLWIAHKEGTDPADMHHFNAVEQYLDEAEEKQEPLIRYQYEDSEDLFDSHTYAKGGRVLHMLRRYLGDEAFFQGLHRYLIENALGCVEVHQLRLAFEAVSGMDLQWFFDQWFLSPGHPELAIHWDYSEEDNVLLTLEQHQDLEKTPLYKLPFTVTLYKEGERIEREFVLDRAYQQFALENGPGTDLILFDERQVLLAEKEQYRGRKLLEKQFVYAQSGLSRVEALDSLTSDARNGEDTRSLLQSALSDSFWVVRELALHRMLRSESGWESVLSLENAILDLAENDPNNAVRSVALEVLAGIDPVKFQPLFYRLINDSSYQVAGAALRAFMDLEGEAASKKELFERLREEENIRMIAPLADYLTESAEVEGAAWMHDKLQLLTGESLYYFIGYYGDYFASRLDVDATEAIARLVALGREHPQNYVRLAAFQSLFGFIDEEGVLKQAKSLFAGEEDEMVRRYQEYYLEPYLNGE
ncbi:aminopeptidase N [Cyclobacterium xiamenense]|uniref:Aminopeptidase N n=1 Tax=Cyclobacterium xiamenense TaxID=1297121 RepID=A0A1H6YL56_9BACT|nr:M1 family metallopeptidase [Cyclobacterium xiamenense]SEJ37960.1 aminopeptidase N [Cyclobacterium xiamenense]